MADNTTHLGNLDADVPLDGYNIGYQTPASSWNELYRTAFEAADTRFRGVSEFGIDKHRYSKNGSFREGSVVVFDPRDTGPYTDGADALADVPGGGTFHLAATDYDVPTQGRLAVSRAIRIEGEGWNAERAGPTINGTKLINKGADAIDQPVIELTNVGGERVEGSEITSLTIEHEGPTSAAVRIADHPRTLVDHVRASGLRDGEAGIEFAGNSYASLCNLVSMTQFTDAGIKVDTPGSHVELFNPYVFSNLNSGIGIDIRDRFTPIYGGESRIHNGPGVRFWRDGESASGGLVFNHYFEDCDTGVLIDGTAPFGEVDIWFSHASFKTGGAGVGTFVDFQNAENCRCWFPQFKDAGGGGELAHFGADSEACGVVHAGHEAHKAPITVASGATDSYQLVKAAVPQSVVDGLTTDPNLVTQVDYNIDANSPVWHNGQQWRGVDTVEAAGVYLSADQTVPPATNEPIAMDTATYGGALFNSSAGTITVDEPGLYETSLNYRMLNVPDNTGIQALIYVNGTREFRTAGAAETGYMAGGRRLELAAGDTIEFRCRHNDTDSATLVGKSGLTFGEVSRVGEV